MSDDKKSTDPGLSAAERKDLRSREAKEAVADHEKAQQVFHKNRERLRAERLAREQVAGPMLYPAPELPDDTALDNVRFSTRIRKANNRRLENRRRGPRGLRCNAAQPPGSRPGLSRPSSRNLGPPVDGRRAARAKGEEMTGCNGFTESERGCLSWRDRTEGEEMIAMRENSGKLWIPQGDERLRELAVSGAALAEIAEKLDRTVSQPPRRGLISCE
jgi:hypothetical protein